MFELLFKYPAGLFARGQFVLLSPWPLWLLALAVLAAAGALAWHMRNHRGLLTGARPAAIWLLQTALVALLLFLLWHPALSVATLRQQQNVIAVLLDGSRSMAIRDVNGSLQDATREDAARSVLNGGLLDALSKKFQVRLYRFGADAERVPKADGVQAQAAATRIGDSLKQVMAENSTLPLGAVVVLSDGADNSGGIDLDTISEIRRQRVPVHTIGFGREKPSKDVEVIDAILPARTLSDARLNAQVTFRQFGFDGDKGKLSVRESGKVLASREVTLKGDGVVQSESLMFNAGLAGPRSFQIAIEPLGGEENRGNNAITRLVNVESVKPRILYVEGEPRWEFKFIRRAMEEDRNLQIMSILRTTQNKFYRQGGKDPKELEDGFPAKAEELFAYQGLIVGDVEANFFTPPQQELIREFANRRGGGVLFLGGRATLSDGGYVKSPMAEMLPVRLLDARGTFHRDNSTVELTKAGRESVICRLEENADRNVERWKKMPQIGDYQQVGEAKPGAIVLLETRKAPLLAMQNYGRGRVAVFATSASWRWQMLQDLKDRTHEMFWQQLLRWLVSETPGQVISSTPKTSLSDEGNVKLRAEVRDKSYQLMPNARVEARVVGPQGVAATVEMAPQPLEEGVYTAEYNAEKPGSYMTEVVVNGEKAEIGRDTVMFRRDDGVAENFRTEQNRELLEKLADQTGGRYYTPASARKLGEEISYSEAGITARETRDLWDMPAIFLAAVLLRASEWVLRRKWGVV